MTAWRRDEGLEEIRVELHGFLSAAAVHSDLRMSVDQLWRLPADFRRRALAVQALTHPLVIECLELVDRLLREMLPTATRAITETRGYVHGAVQWSQTAQRRIAYADPTVFVSRPALKSFDTNLARFVMRVLVLLDRLCTTASLETGGLGVGRQIGNVSAEINRLLNDRKLRSARSVRAVDTKVIDSLVRRDARIEKLRTVARAAEDALSGGGPESLANVLLTGVLRPSTDDALFELWVGLSILKHIRAAGGVVIAAPFGRDAGSPVFAEIAYEGSTYLMHWQRSYRRTLGLAADGRYVEALLANGLKRAALRPDFLIYRADAPRQTLRLVEVKYSSRDGYRPDRAGVLDSLAYLKDLEQEPDTAPRCLVVASSSAAEPARALICITGPSSLAAAAVFDQLWH